MHVLTPLIDLKIYHSNSILFPTFLKIYYCPYHQAWSHRKAHQTDKRNLRWRIQQHNFPNEIWTNSSNQIKICYRSRNTMLLHIPTLKNWLNYHKIYMFISRSTIPISILQDWERFQRKRRCPPADSTLNFHEKSYLT